ncbi:MULTISPECIES: phage tail fiber domain-containing protein [Klebsiella]|uniref:phage tail fiber domain-containing protein n=1 Tax=Klebsiella TaxID=570 RepID=UPI0012B79CB8|nr:MULTISPECIES: phage tail fiber protein [Klebsiella]MDM4112737.1 phage tail fiber protein [Klebsiella michiganensis]
MSVPNQTPYNIYTANGLTTVFAYEFYLISASDIQVTINGNEVTSGYTVSGVGNTGGGEVTFLTAPANGATVIFERVTPTYRLTDYQDNGDLLADTVNKDFDRLWMAIQRAFIYLGVALTRPLFGGGPFNANGYRIANLADPVDDQDAATKKFVIENTRVNLARTLRVPESSVPVLPSIIYRKNKILAFNDQGNPIAILPESGSASDVLLELASSDGFKWVGQFPSVGSLAATSGSHGDRVLVRSYHEGGSEGGGQFVYDEARAAENDGVTVFNGWVRQIVNNTLTNYDAGIIPFDGSDATSRLSALFNNAPDGTHLYIIGHHQISGPVTIKGKNALTFHSDYGAISGYERRESWVWGADSDFEYGSGNLGILSFFNCHKIIVDGLFIDGAHLQRPDSKEWGDCMVRYEHCTYMTIRNCKGDGFGGWGIFGLYSDYADIHNNVISRVSRQSGINAFACSSYSKVYNNTLNDVGLYGVEFETFDSKTESVTYGNQAYNNEIRGAKFGLTVVGNHNDALIYSNKCYGCQTGVFAIKYTGKNIVIRDNSSLDCMRGVQVNASKNVLTLRNTLTVNEVPAFVIDDQYNAVLDITADRMAFYSINSVRAGYQIQIRGVTYTVASSVQDPTRTDYQAQSGGLYLNTLTTALAADVEHCDNVYVSTTSLGMTPYGFGMNVERSSSAIVDGSSNNRFISNLAAGKVAAGCFTNSVYTDVSAIKEWWIDNQTSPSTDNPYTCRWMRFNQGANAAINVQGARHDKLSSIFSSATNGSTLNIFGNRILQYGSNLAVASGGQFPPHYYISESPFAIVSIKVVLTNYSSSEDVYLRINGTENMVKVANANTSETAVVSYTARKLFFTLSTVGLMYFRLATASNTAKVGSYTIEIEIM